MKQTNKIPKPEHHLQLDKVWRQAKLLDEYKILGIPIGFGSLAGIVPV